MTIYASRKTWVKIGILHLPFFLWCGWFAFIEGIPEPFVMLLCWMTFVFAWLARFKIELNPEWFQYRSLLNNVKVKRSRIDVINHNTAPAGSFFTIDVNIVGRNSPLRMNGVVFEQTN